MQEGFYHLRTRIVEYRLVGAFEVLKIWRNGYLEIGEGSGHILAIIGEKRIYIQREVKLQLILMEIFAESESEELFLYC